MRLRQLIIYAFLFLVLGGFYYMYDVRLRGERQQMEAAETEIFAEPFDEIVGMEYRSGDTTYHVVKKGPDDWWITAPIETPADKWVVEGMIREALAMRKGRTVAETPNVKEYGLDPPPLALRLLSPSDRPDASPRPRTPWLELGDESPVGNACFARLSDSRQVFVLNTADRDRLMKSLYDLRDKSLVLTPGEKITRVLIKRADGEEVLLNKSSIKDWKILEPENAKADDEAAQDMVYQGLKGRVREFLLPEPGKDYGFETPRLVVKVAEGDRITAELVIGQANMEEAAAVGAEGPGVWAKSSEREEIMLVPPGVVALLDKGFEGWKDRHLLPFDEARVHTLRLTGGSVDITAEKPDITWNVAAGAKPDVSAEAVGALVAGLAKLKYASVLGTEPYYLSWTGLDAPDLTVELVGPDTTTHRVALAFRPLPEGRMAVRADDGPVVTVSRSDLMTLLPPGLAPAEPVGGDLPAADGEALSGTWPEPGAGN